MGIIKFIKEAFPSMQTPAPMPTTHADSNVEAASIGRRLRTWGLSTSGPNTLLTESAANVRQRSQHSYRNNPIATSYIDSLVSNMVGTGITPRWDTGDPGLDKEIMDLWTLSTGQLDYDGVWDFYGLQALVARTFLLSGDAICQFKYLRPGSTLVPIQVKIMEADQFYEDYNGALANGNSLVMGVEFNPNQQRVAYILYKFHPGELGLSYAYNSTDTVRVKVSDALHVYKPFRPGQCRGWPGMSNILTRLKAIDEFEDATLDTQKTAAMFSAFILKPYTDHVTPGIEGEEVTYNGSSYLGLEPGTITELYRGEDIKFASPPNMANAYEPWIKHQLQRIASGAGITYEQLTGDLSGVNYTSIRAGLLEFQRKCKMLQYHNLIHMFCRPFAAKWMDYAHLSGTLRIPRYTKYRTKITYTKWDPDGWEWVDPLKHATAKKLMVRSGFTSRSRVVSETGTNAEVVDAENAADNARADANSLTYDSDGRQSAAGPSANSGDGHLDASESKLVEKE